MQPTAVASTDSSVVATGPTPYCTPGTMSGGINGVAARSGGGAQLTPALHSAAASSAAMAAPVLASPTVAGLTGPVATARPAAPAAAAAAAALLNAAPAAPAAAVAAAPSLQALTLQSLQGTLASASLANSLLQPGAAPYGLQTSTGSSVASAWSAPNLSSGLGLGLGLGMGAVGGDGGNGGTTLLSSTLPTAATPLPSATTATAAPHLGATARDAKVGIVTRTWVPYVLYRQLRTGRAPMRMFVCC